MIAWGACSAISQPLSIQAWLTVMADPPAAGRLRTQLRLCSFCIGRRLDDRPDPCRVDLAHDEGRQAKNLVLEVGLFWAVGVLAVPFGAEVGKVGAGLS